MRAVIGGYLSPVLAVGINPSDVILNALQWVEQEAGSSRCCGINDGIPPNLFQAAAVLIQYDARRQ